MKILSRRAPRLALLVTVALMLALSLAAAPAHAERDLSITSVYLNGFSTKEISVRPGARIQGNLGIRTSSSSLFRTHTGVWLPSWERANRNAMQQFLNSVGGSDQSTVAIDLAAPAVPGTYYLLFCFDRKGFHDMYTELTMRSDEQIWANGRAIKIVVDPGAAEAVRPSSRELAAPLAVAGTVNGVAGNGTGKESWWKITTGSLDSRNRGDALRFRLSGLSPDIDLDLEIQDAYGRRRGYSENEGSKLESSVVRVVPGEVLYARVYAYRAGDEAQFQLVCERVPLASHIADPSAGQALAVGNGYTATARGGEGSRAAWYAVPLAGDGRIEVEVRGQTPSKDLDLFLYDQTGNKRAASREEGSAREFVVLDPAESGVYYVRVAAHRGSDESDFAITVRVTNPAVLVNPGSSTTPASTPSSGSPTYGASPVSVSGFDSVQRFPVGYDVARGRDFEGWFKVGTEASFLVEVKTGWGDAGKIDAIRVIAPDGRVLWEKKAEGRGWEADRITAVGAGLYRIVISHSGEVARRGQIEVSGLADPHLYRSSAGTRPGDLGTGGPGLDAAERAVLQQLHEMMKKRGEGLSYDESELLRQLDDYFTRN